MVKKLCGFRLSNNSLDILTILLVASLLVITMFFFVENVNQQRYSNQIIKACNVSRNQIAVDFDFNLIEYDKNKAYKPIEDFNILGALN